MERLDKVLAGTGRWSRREVKDLVRQGRVRIDGVTARTAEEKLDPDAAAISVDGQPVETAAVYLCDAPQARRGTVCHRGQPAAARCWTCCRLSCGNGSLSPVGRLDKDTEGLLLLTNDGALAHRLLSPKSHVDKVYYARVEGTLEPADTAAFAAGMTLGDGLCCLPAGLEILSPGEALVTLREGKFHQVKRMLAARGKPVTYLKRLSMGPLRLDPELAPGAFRVLTPEEKNALVDCH